MQFSLFCLILFMRICIWVTYYLNIVELYACSSSKLFFWELLYNFLKTSKLGLVLSFLRIIHTFLHIFQAYVVWEACFPTRFIIFKTSECVQVKIHQAENNTLLPIPMNTRHTGMWACTKQKHGIGHTAGNHTNNNFISKTWTIIHEQYTEELYINSKRYIFIFQEQLWTIIL